MEMCYIIKYIEGIRSHTVVKSLQRILIRHLTRATPKEIVSYKIRYDASKENSNKVAVNNILDIEESNIISLK